MDESVSKTFGEAQDAAARLKKRLQQVKGTYILVVAAAVLVLLPTLISSLPNAQKFIVVAVVLVLSMNVAVVAMRFLRKSEAAALKALITALETKNEPNAPRLSRASGPSGDVSRERSLGGRARLRLQSPS